MQILAGTSKGVFVLEGSDRAPRQVLESRGVREIAQLHGRTFAGTGSGLYVSDDGGSSWQLAGLDDKQVWQIRSDGDGSLYAGTAPTGLYRSTDDGASWVELESLATLAAASGWCVPLDPPLPAAARALVVNGDQLWVGVEVGGIACSNDAGDTWSVVLPGDNPDLHMMYAHPEKPDTLYASTGYGRLDGIADMVEGNAGVFRSDDAGTTWQYAWQGVTPRYSRPMCIDDREPFGLTVASAPTAFSNHKEDGGAKAMLYRSEDGGGSWRSLCDAAHSPSRENFHGLTVDPERAGGVLVGTDTGEVWRVSNESSWTLCAQGMPAVLSITARS